MDTVYLTDGSFEGLLSAIHQAYYGKDHVVDILKEPPAQRTFVTNYVDIRTDEEKARKVYGAIQKKIASQSARDVMQCWLSELPGCGGMILRYLRLGFRVGSIVNDMLTHDDVMPLKRAVQRVGFETHRMLGLCRFAKTDAGYYLCAITPDHNILTLITPHFVSRMGDQPFVILDKRREIATIHNGRGQWYLSPAKAAKSAPWSCDERDFQMMWQKYFETIAIEGRTNPRCQRNLMPKRYWVNLTEMNSEANRL